MVSAGGFAGAGPGGFGAGSGGPGVRFEDLFGGTGQGGFGDLGDLFSVFTGGRGARGASRRARGSDLETEVRVSFDEAMRGTIVPVKLRGPIACKTCGGSGAEPGTAPVTCPECGGSGQSVVNQGFFQMARTCPRCGGSGRILEPPCRAGRGSGGEEGP